MQDGNRKAAWGADGLFYVLVTQDQIREIKALRAPSNKNRIVHSKLLRVLGLASSELQRGGELAGWIRLVWRGEASGRVWVTLLARPGAGPVSWGLRGTEDAGPRTLEMLAQLEAAPRVAA
jgi:hypothetical protein